MNKVKEAFMDGNFVGLAAVVMSLGIPMAAMYTFFRVRRLRNCRRRRGRGGLEFCWWRVRSAIS
jgi:hypothetical protein